MTNKRISLGCAVALMLSLALPAGATVKAADVIQPAIDGFVRPGYATLHDAASSMAASMKALCSAPSPASLDAARQKFAGLVGAWSQVEMIRFGPVSEGNRLERMLFWPDRKGTGLRQVQAALADKDESVTDPSRLAEKSVALQGLGALEFLLYGTGAETLATDNDPYRCRYGQSVAANVETMSADISAAWNSSDGFASVWAHPGPDNPLYRDGDEAVTELMGVFINGLEIVRDVRLKGFFGKTADADRPKQAIYWRSNQTAASLAANLAGLEPPADGLPSGSGTVAGSKVDGGFGAYPVRQRCGRRGSGYRFHRCRTLRSRQKGKTRPFRTGHQHAVGTVRHADDGRIRPDRRLFVAGRRLNMSRDGETCVRR